MTFLLAAIFVLLVLMLFPMTFWLPAIFVLLVLMLFGHMTRSVFKTGLYTRKCPHCRESINGHAIVCPHCTQPTGWHKDVSHWDRLKSKREKAKLS